MPQQELQRQRVDSGWGPGRGWGGHDGVGDGVGDGDGVGEGVGDGVVKMWDPQVTRATTVKY